MSVIDRAISRKVERDGSVRIHDHSSITLPRQIAVDYRALVKAYREHEQRIAELERELAGCRSFQRSVDEALNTGDGVYRP